MMTHMIRRGWTGAALMVMLHASQGCSLIEVPRPARAAPDPRSSCGSYFAPGVDMTAALLLGFTTISVLFAPDQMTPNGESVDTPTHVTRAAGVGALASGFVASGIVGMNWIERCRKLRAAKADEPPPLTLRVQKRLLPPEPEEPAPSPLTRPPPDAELGASAAPPATRPADQPPATPPSATTPLR